MNKAFLIGRLTEAPALRQTPQGVSVATLRMAVNRRFNREMTDYFTVIVWRQLAETCAKYLVKGQQVAVCGEIQTRSYEKDGQKRYVTEIAADDIEFLAKPGPAGAERGGAPASHEEDLFAKEMGGVLMEDEELPF